MSQADSTSGINSLDDVLNDQGLRKRFKVFLEEHLADESLLFHESVERFENLVSQDERDEMGRYIVDNFVEENSLYWINISASTRNTVMRLENFPPESFDLAKKEIYRLMASNFYHAFVKEILCPNSEEASSKLDSQSVTSFQVLFSALARVNTREEFLECPGCSCTAEDLRTNNICEVRRAFIQETLEANRVHEGPPLKLSSLFRKRLSMLRSKRSSIAESKGPPVAVSKMKRTQNAFRRIFGSKKTKKNRRMSFWAKFE